jgi:ppGpp synthetase/RelA/SpoT-type nucleotidyltranferase
VPRSQTTSQINALGERLRRAVRPASADLLMLQRLRADYDAPLAEVEDRLRANGLRTTSRLKTVGTIIDKLKRERTRLSRMQDIAGVRLVVGQGLGPSGVTEQDRIVEVVSDLFPGAITVDRRLRPSHGYRAVHLIPTVDERPVEIQIRTEDQDAWAHLMEAVADFLGRQVRYGEEPDDPDALVGSRTRRDLVRELMKYSEISADIEEAVRTESFDRVIRLTQEASRLLRGLMK